MFWVLLTFADGNRSYYRNAETGKRGEFRTRSQAHAAGRLAVEVLGEGTSYEVVTAKEGPTKQQEGSE